MNTRIRSRVLGGSLAAALLTGLGVGLVAAPANAATTATWDRIAECESSGNWKINTGNGYYGGLQFSLATWRGHGGKGMPNQASKAEQIRIAEKVLDSQGWGAWPECSARAGLSGHEGASAGDAARSAGASSQGERTTSRSETVPSSGKTYTVRAGDTLGGIAARLGVHGGWKRLAAANADRVPDPGLIFPGQRLALPA